MLREFEFRLHYLFKITLPSHDQYLNIFTLKFHRVIYTRNYIYPDR